MKWRKKMWNDGDIRTVERFAWLPVETDGYWVWLEKYQSVESYFDCWEGRWWRVLRRQQIEG